MGPRASVGYRTVGLQADELPGRSMKLVCCLKRSQPIAIISVGRALQFRGTRKSSNRLCQRAGLNHTGQRSGTGPDYLA
jgi:hypothetical protein